MTRNVGGFLHEWPLPVGSRCFERRIERALANAVCERFLGSVRRECLDHFLILHEKHLHRLLKAYVVYFNQARPHQGLGQRIPEPLALSASPSSQPHQVLSIPVLGGLHHDYQRTA
jgi:putative transposase